MKLTWLNKKNNDSLIIFFNGWGMDENVVKHLEPENYDVLTICDYNSLEALPDLSNYDKKYVVAWSMGVMVATLFNIECDSATAINGTPFPIHVKYGINPKIYKLMELGFDDNTKDKFIAKMFNEMPSDFIPPSRDTENRKAELTVLKSYEANAEYQFDRVIVSNNDKIIPTESQLNYWKSPEIIEGGHCVFYGYKRWKELL